MRIRFLSAQAIYDGIAAVAPELGFSIAEDAADITVQVSKVHEDISLVGIKGTQAYITYGGGKSRFFRALAGLVQWVKDGITDAKSEEHPIFENNGAMVDMSRNAVMNLPTVKAVLRKMALMGMNTFMLYTEDTYEITDRPYFGYMRGRYTREEIKELDSYAAMLGIELIPCIQVLGHLKTHLSHAAAAPYKDTDSVLLVGSEATYRLIDDMFKTVRECFTTKRVHIGMDETMDLGRGKYLTQNGHRPRHEIFLEHLNKVADMAKGHGLQPMMWSDMFFRMAGENIQGYSDYHPDVQLPAHICESVPKGVRQVFWDYYRDNEAFYADNLKKHELLGENTVFAGGIWGWSGFGVYFSRSLANTRPALEACKKQGVRDVIATVWHNGSEAQLITALAGMAWYADFGYTGVFDPESIRQCFECACGKGYAALLKTEAIEYPHGGKVGISRALMYNDPLVGLVDKHIEKQGLTGAYYQSLTEELAALQCESGLFAPALAAIKACSAVLENKTDFGVRLTKAYAARDMQQLAMLARECEGIVEKLYAFKDAYRTAWMSYNKPFGYEVHDIRLGGVIARFETARARITAYLAGEVERIEELEEERQFVDGCGYMDATDFFDGHFLWESYKDFASVNILE